MNLSENVKYIKVDWPESQKFIELDNIYHCLDKVSSVFVPEDLYEETMYKLQFPKRYENTNLGTIVCYEDKAVVNEKDVYLYDKDVKKGSKVLIYNHDIVDRPRWILSKCMACSKGFPIVLKDTKLCPGLNCEIIGVKTDD